MISLVDISITTGQSDSASYLLPIVTTSIKMHPSQSGALMRLPISVEQDLLRCGRSIIFGSIATLGFVSRKSLNRNALVGKCICSPKSEFVMFVVNEIRNNLMLIGNQHFSLLITNDGSRA